MQELSEALRRVSLLSQGRSYGVRLSFGKDQLVLQAENPEFGSATETLSIFYPYEALSIGFNARYLLDVLSHCHAKSMNMQLVDDLSPAVLVPDGDRDYLAVVMPVRI